jgi:hypothetical protein
MTKDPTQKHIKSILKYDPDTGIFIWLKCVQKNKIGEIAGNINNRGYRTIGNHLAHRLAWTYVTGIAPKVFIDHINGIKDDNRFLNLREATAFENNQNAKLSSNNRSGIKGVSWNKEKGKWQANVMASGVYHFLGRFDNIEDAELAVVKKRVDLHGEFANHG